jgi:hypothetical protein
VELDSALKATEDFAKLRIMKRVRRVARSDQSGVGRGAVYEYPPVTREFAMRAMATGASAPQVAMLFRIPHYFIAPWLVEGEDYLVPSVSFFLMARLMIGPFTSIIRAMELGQADKHNQICVD